MADQENADAISFKLLDELADLGSFLGAKSCRRLVNNENTRIEVNGARNATTGARRPRATLPVLSAGSSG
jgi:hypothetical protein